MRSLLPGIALGIAFVVAVPSQAQQMVGIPICDEFLAKYETCAKDKMQAAQRGAIVDSINQMRVSWKQIVTDSPQSKGDLEAQCRQTLESMKTSLASAYGCRF